MQQQQHSTVGGSSQSHLNLLQNSDGIKQQQDSKQQESVANDLMFYTGIYTYVPMIIMITMLF
jgi:hypothetical protein